jgi:hypothetical protein
MTDEKLVRLCDCGACDTHVGTHPVGSPDTDGAYCSDTCAGHAGGPLVAARAEHREETP